MTTTPTSGSGSTVRTRATSQTRTGRPMCSRRPTADKQVKVKVSFTDGRGSTETRTSSLYPADGLIDVPNSAATGSPTISGTAEVRKTLTVTAGTIADTNGLPSGTFPAGYNLPVGARRRRRHLERARHRRGDIGYIQAGHRRPGEESEGEGILHRRAGQRGDADERRLSRNRDDRCGHVLDLRRSRARATPRTPTRSGARR